MRENKAGAKEEMKITLGGILPLLHTIATFNKWTFLVVRQQRYEDSQTVLNRSDEGRMKRIKIHHAEFDTILRRIGK